MLGLLGAAGVAATGTELIKEAVEPTQQAGQNNIQSMYDGAMDVAAGIISQREYNKRIKKGYYRK